MTPLDECCCRCTSCDLVFCRDERPSPGEPDTCDTCWEADQ